MPPSPRDVSRFRKIRDLAASPSASAGERANAQRILVQLRDKHPEVEACARAEDDRLARERVEKARGAGAWPPPGWKPGEPMPKPPPLAPDASVLDQIAYKAFLWAIDQLERATNGTVKKVSKPRTGHTHMSTQQERLINALSQDVGIEGEYVEDDDKQTCMEISLVIPLPLWERVMKTRDTKLAFVEWFDAASVARCEESDAEAVDEEGIDESESEEVADEPSSDIESDDGVPYLDPEADGDPDTDEE